MSDSENTIMSAQVPVVLRDELMRLAGAHDRSMSAEVRAACRAYIERQQSFSYGGSASDQRSRRCAASAAPEVGVGQ